jgi:hypothetical protein
MGNENTDIEVLFHFQLLRNSLDDLTNAKIFIIIHFSIKYHVHAGSQMEGTKFSFLLNLNENTTITSSSIDF